MRRLSVLIVLALAIASCAPVKREQVEQEVLRADPAFSAVMAKHRELTSRIETYNKELAVKRTKIEGHIKQLRQDLAEAIAQAKKKTANVKREMEPQRKELELALSMAAEELRSQRVQRASIGRAIAQLRKAAKAGQEGWSAQQRTQHDHQLAELLKDTQRLDHEIAALKEHIRLIKLKLLLIKL